MLSVFKLVSCQPGASRELDLRAQGLKSSKCSKLIFGNIIVVRYVRDKFEFFWNKIKSPVGVLYC